MDQQPQIVRLRLKIARTPQPALLRSGYLLSAPASHVNDAAVHIGRIA